MRRIDDLIELINNIVDVEQNEIDDKDVEFKNLKNLKLCLHRCDESTTWLIETETRISNSNWSQRFLFWTNWILWLINWQSFEKIFLFVCDSSFFQIFSFFFHQSMIFLLYRDVRAEYILRKHWNDVSECTKKDVINITKKTFSRRILESRIEIWYFDYWWSLMFDDSVLKLTCLLLLKRSKRYVERCFVYLMFFSLMIYN